MVDHLVSILLFVLFLLGISFFFWIFQVFLGVLCDIQYICSECGSKLTIRKYVSTGLDYSHSGKEHFNVYRKCLYCGHKNQISHIVIPMKRD